MVLFSNLRENIRALEEEGHLRRISREVNKDTELMPLVRCQFRGLEESKRSSWLFENVTDSNGNKYDIPVGVALVGPSREVYRFNLGCETDAELVEKWQSAVNNPLDPKVVTHSPVKDVILEGEDLEGDGNGIEALPVPISTPGFDPAPFFTSGYVITKEPDSGIVNMGTYRCHVKNSKTCGVYFGNTQDLQSHWDKAAERGTPLEAAIVIGAPPHISMVSTSKVAYDESELAVAGGLIGEPLEVVDCETVDIQVPASAEFVLEGTLSLEEYPEGPFGEFTGYMGESTFSPNFELSCMTHRENPIYQAFISQMPPSESSMLRKVGYEQNILKHLKNTSLTNVMDVVLHQASGSVNFLVIQLDKNNQTEPWQAMNAAMGYTSAVGKFIVTVDKDIDPHDLKSVIWAMSFRVQPADDVAIEKYRRSPLDPVSAPFGVPKEERYFPGRTGDSAVLVDATLPWDYPPISLPRREYMEQAISLWEDLDLPELNLVEPWYGISLGAWSDDDRAAAEAATDGDYFESN